jgi:hypothetical protein
LYAATKLANNAELKLKSFKIKVTKAFETGMLQMDIKISEVKGETGKRVAEFIRYGGPVIEFYKFSKEICKKVAELGM